MQKMSNVLQVANLALRLTRAGGESLRSLGQKTHSVRESTSFQLRPRVINNVNNAPEVV